MNAPETMIANLAVGLFFLSLAVNIKLYFKLKRLAENDETEAHLFVTSISNWLGFDEWHDEFIDWYKPENWFNARRAACGFLASKIEPLIKQPPEEQ